MNGIVRIGFALTALAGGALAAVAGDPRPALAGDEIAAVDLAASIRDRRDGLVVVDARADDAIAQDRVPGARPLASVDAAAIGARSIVVLYADETIAADAAGVLRERLGTPRVLRLHGGYRAWNDEVLFPTLRSDASERQRDAFAARAMLARYFGGTPRQIEPGAAVTRTRSRRGC